MTVACVCVCVYVCVFSWHLAQNATNALTAGDENGQCGGRSGAWGGGTLPPGRGGGTAPAPTTVVDGRASRCRWAPLTPPGATSGLSHGVKTSVVFFGSAASSSVNNEVNQGFCKITTVPGIHNREAIPQMSMKPRQSCTPYHGQTSIEKGTRLTIYVRSNST